MAWLQLAALIALMYLVVGTAGYWGLRKRREQAGRQRAPHDNRHN